MKKSNDGVLLVGNGINLLFEKDEKEFKPKNENWNFEGMSWKNIIEQLRYNYGTAIKHCDIEHLPLPMQIVIVTKDNVDKAMQSFSKSMIKEKISEDKKRFCEKILSLPVESIITTNYSYELEQAAGILPNRNSYFKIREDTKQVTKREKYLRLYTYNNLVEKNKKIWHIHGDAATPNSVVMGHYYYGKLLKEIENRVAEFIKNYKSCKEEEVVKLSWVDEFLLKDVYMLGFGFDTSEIDLWWLACCKKRNFPNTKIHYYTCKQEIDVGYKALLDSYNIEIHNEIKVDEKNYIEFYETALDDIKKKVK